MKPRSRIRYFAAILLVIGAGLLWRSSTFSLPAFYKKYGGDALWALMVFLGFGFIFKRASTIRVGLMAICFSCAIEFSQLYHAPWIESIRATRLGALTIGSGFNWPDMLAYAVGIAIGIFAEQMARRLSQN